MLNAAPGSTNMKKEDSLQQLLDTLSSEDQKHIEQVRASSPAKLLYAWDICADDASRFALSCS